MVFRGSSSSSGAARGGTEERGGLLGEPTSETDSTSGSSPAPGSCNSLVQLGRPLVVQTGVPEAPSNAAGAPSSGTYVGARVWTFDGGSTTTWPAVTMRFGATAVDTVVTANDGTTLRRTLSLSRTGGQASAAPTCDSSTGTGKPSTTNALVIAYDADHDVVYAYDERSLIALEAHR